MSSTPSFLPNTFRPVRDGWPQIFAAWLPVCLFLCALAVESTPIFGADRTSHPLHTALHAMAGRAVDSNWTFLHHLIRKTGHFLGYGFLGLLLFRALRMTRTRGAFLRGELTSVAALLLTFLAAGVDEWHQAFLPNRSGRFSDVLLDTAGAATLLLAMYATRRVTDAMRHGKPRANRGQGRAIQFSTGASGRTTLAA